MGKAKRRKQTPKYRKPTSQHDLGDKKPAIADYNKAIGLKPD